MVRVEHTQKSDKAKWTSKGDEARDTEPLIRDAEDKGALRAAVANLQIPVGQVQPVGPSKDGGRDRFSTAKVREQGARDPAEKPAGAPPIDGISKIKDVSADAITVDQFRVAARNVIDVKLRYKDDPKRAETAIGLATMGVRDPALRAALQDVGIKSNTSDLAKDPQRDNENEALIDRVWKNRKLGGAEGADAVDLTKLPPTEGLSPEDAGTAKDLATRKPKAWTAQDWNQAVRIGGEFPETVGRYFYAQLAEGPDAPFKDAQAAYVVAVDASLADPPDTDTMALATPPEMAAKSVPERDPVTGSDKDPRHHRGAGPAKDLDSTSSNAKRLLSGPQDEAPSKDDVVDLGKALYVAHQEDPLLYKQMLLRLAPYDAGLTDQVMQGAFAKFKNAAHRQADGDQEVSRELAAYLENPDPKTPWPIHFNGHGLFKPSTDPESWPTQKVGGREVKTEHGMGATGRGSTRRIDARDEYIKPPAIKEGDDMDEVFKSMTAEQKTALGRSIYALTDKKQVEVPPEDVETWSKLVEHQLENNPWFTDPKNFTMENIPNNGRGKLEHDGDPEMVDAYETVAKAFKESMPDQNPGVGIALSLVEGIGFLPGLGALLRGPLQAVKGLGGVAGRIASRAEGAAGATTNGVVDTAAVRAGLIARGASPVTPEAKALAGAAPDVARVDDPVASAGKGVYETRGPRGGTGEGAASGSTTASGTKNPKTKGLLGKLGFGKTPSLLDDPLAPGVKKALAKRVFDLVGPLSTDLRAALSKTPAQNADEITKVIGAADYNALRGLLKDPSPALGGAPTAAQKHAAIEFIKSSLRLDELPKNASDMMKKADAYYLNKMAGLRRGVVPGQPGPETPISYKNRLLAGPSLAEGSTTKGPRAWLASRSFADDLVLDMQNGKAPSRAVAKQALARLWGNDELDSVMSWAAKQARDGKLRILFVDASKPGRPGVMDDAGVGGMASGNNVVIRLNGTEEVGELSGRVAHELQHAMHMGLRGGGRPRAGASADPATTPSTQNDLDDIIRQDMAGWSAADRPDNVSWLDWETAGSKFEQLHRYFGPGGFDPNNPAHRSLMRAEAVVRPLEIIAELGEEVGVAVVKKLSPRLWKWVQNYLATT